MSKVPGGRGIGGAARGRCRPEQRVSHRVGWRRRGPDQKGPPASSRRPNRFSLRSAADRGGRW